MWLTGIPDLLISDPAFQRSTIRRGQPHERQRPTIRCCRCGPRGARRARERRSVRSGASRHPGGQAREPKKKVNLSNAWQEARALIWARRGRLALGLALMLVNRLAGLVLPATSKYLIDDVIGKHRADLLVPLAFAAGAATVVQAVTSFALSQVLGVAAQRAITDMRRRVEAHVARLPVSYFDSTQSGVLISRIMTDAEGIRNLVGTGLVQLTGSIVTAIAALAYLFYLNWWLTLVTLVAAGRVRRRDGARVQPPAAALPRARQDQRRGHRPAERNARRHPHRQDLHRGEARGAGVHRRACTGCSATSRSRSPACRPSRRSRPSSSA